MKSLTFAALFFVVLSAYASAKQRCYPIQKKLTTTTTTTLEPTTSTTTSEPTTTTKDLSIDCYFTAEIGPKLLCAIGSGMDAFAANDFCKAKSERGKLYLIESAEEKTEFIQILTSKTLEIFGTLQQIGWFLNGFESNTTTGEWFSDSNDPLNTVATPTEGNGKCVLISGDSGAYALIRWVCNGTSSFLCQL